MITIKNITLALVTILSSNYMLSSQDNRLGKVQTIINYFSKRSNSDSQAKSINDQETETRVPFSEIKQVFNVLEPERIKDLVFQYLDYIKPKTILIICDNVESVNTKSIGGTERVMIEITKELKNLDFEVGFMDIPYPCFTIGPNQISAYPNFFNNCGVQRQIKQKLDEFNPDYILINLHGIMSYQAACYCHNNNIPFTAFHSSRMPEVVSHNLHVPRWFPAYFVNRFLSKANCTLVPTLSFQKELQLEGLKNVILWPHGVDLHRFSVPDEKTKQMAIKTCNLQDKERPLILYVTRIAKEKNIDFFLKSNLPGTKILVGPASDGYKIEDLQKTYPNIVFTGPKTGNDLIKYYHSADIFGFTSKHDLFGLVLLEALASGLPIIAFNVHGPRDVAPNGCSVSLLAQSDKEFEDNAKQLWADIQSSRITSKGCRAYAERFSWARAAQILSQNLFNVHSTNSYLEQRENCKWSD